MPTECTPKRFEFEAVARRAVVACFDGRVSVEGVIERYGARGAGRN
jgi:hypothetical protein